MVDVVLFNRDAMALSILKRRVGSLLDGVDHTLVVFREVMDMMDYLYSTRPEKWMVFFCEAADTDGEQIALKLYEINKKGRFCLIRSTSGESVEALFYNGVAYWIPSAEDDECLERCVQRFSEFYDDSFGKTLMLKNKSGVQAIPMNRILYFMSDKRKVVVYEKDATYEFYYKLDEIAEMAGKSFLRCHQSYLVNMDKIKQFVDDGLTLITDEFIPISRKKYFYSKRTYLSYVSDTSF